MKNKLLFFSLFFCAIFAVFLIFPATSSATTMQCTCVIMTEEEDKNFFDTVTGDSETKIKESCSAKAGARGGKLTDITNCEKVDEAKQPDSVAPAQDATSSATVQCTCEYDIMFKTFSSSITADDEVKAQKLCVKKADEHGGVKTKDAAVTNCKEADTAAPAQDATGAGTGTGSSGTSGECLTKGATMERGLFTRGLADKCVGCGDCTKCDVLKVVDNVLKFALQIAGPLAILVIIIGGFLYITALGNDERVQAGKRAITAAVIGYIVVLVSWMIINFVINTLTGGTGESAKIFDKVWHSPDCGTVNTAIGTGAETGTETETGAETAPETKTETEANQETKVGGAGGTY